MTQTIAIHGSTAEINPLYIKLRRRFACQGDRTIGEKKAQEAIRDGYQPYAAPARRAVPGASCNTAQIHTTQANRLPKAPAPVRRGNLSVGAIAILVVCALLLVFLLVSGVRISELNREISTLQNTAAIQANKEEITASVHGTNEASAQPSEDASLYRDNVLRSFSEN